MTNVVKAMVAHLTDLHVDHASYSQRTTAISVELFKLYPTIVAVFDVIVFVDDKPFDGE